MNTKIAWALSHGPFVAMASTLLWDYTQWESLLPYSGYLALSFFILILSLNPFIQITPSLWAIKLNRYRRQLGVASFSYAFLHVLCFVIKRSLDGKWKHFLHPSLLPVVFVGFPILLVLAITSHPFFLKELSFPLWKRIHKKVYWAEVAIILHLLLTKNFLLATWAFSPLLFLQLVRFYRKNRKTPSS